jgi:protein SCO1/2
MKGLTLALLLGCLVTGAAAQAVPQSPVGVNEHLGRKVGLDLGFVDELGQPISLRSLIDRPTILTLNYFRCTGICSPLLNGVIDAVNSVPQEPGKEFRVLTVSFDENDEPEVARKKGENILKQLKRPCPPSAWRLLTGKAPEIAALTGAVGFEFKKVGREFAHPGVIVILSPEGVITRYMYGITFPRADVQMALIEAAKGEARPTVVKALQFCLVFDVQSREAVFRLTRIVGGIIVLVGLGFMAALTRRGRPEETKTP